MKKKKEKIYIIPTEYGLMYGLGIFVSLIGGAVYSNNLAFVLCFFLVALFLIGMVQTHTNLRNLHIEKVQIFLSPSSGQGQGVIWLKSTNSEGHNQLRVRCADTDDIFDFSVPQIHPKSLHPHYFSFRTGDWGSKSMEKIKLSTRYPFGFFYVWRNEAFAVEYKIYPEPLGEQPMAYRSEDEAETGHWQAQGGNDFQEHRAYQLGDSQKHIDWKAYARGRDLLTKKFEEGEGDIHWLDYDRAIGTHDEKMHQLAQWIFQCEQSGSPYALKLQSAKATDVGRGERHKQMCLALLADHRGSG